MMWIKSTWTGIIISPRVVYLHKLLLKVVTYKKIRKTTLFFRTTKYYNILFQILNLFMTLLLWDIINKYIYWQLYKYCVISSSVRQYYYLLGFIISTTCKWNMIVFLLTSVAKLREVLDILFLSNHNVHKSLCGLCFRAPYPFIEKF